MLLSDLLSEETVKVISTASSKKMLMHGLAEMAHQVHGVDQEVALHALQERESLGPTGVGHGVALPHARIPDIDKVHGVFMRLEKPIDFDAVDRQPVDLVFALFAPLEAGVEHLKALALVSRTLRDSSICAKLRANRDSDTLHTILTAVESVQAA